jgi:hypothetical protein
MRRSLVVAAALVLITAGASQPAPAIAAAANLKCTIKFTMKSWSAFYKTSQGTGTIQCSDGQSAKVRLSAKGGGLTVGKSSIEDGRGKFSEVATMNELFGTYVAAEAHAGAVKTSDVQAMTKGDVSLALSGTGRGFDLGVELGALTISR